MPLMIQVEILQDADTPTHTWKAGTKPQVEASLATHLVAQGIAKYVNGPDVRQEKALGIAGESSAPQEPLEAVDTPVEKRKRKSLAEKIQ